MNSRLSTPESVALAKICREWYVSFGVLAVVVVISLWASPLWMPLYDLLFAVALALFGPAKKIAPGQPCGRITLVTIYTLLASGVVCFIINLAYHTQFIHLFFDISTLNHSIPYITSLVVFPICTVFTFILNSKSVYALHVRNCHLHNQYNPSQPAFGRTVHAVYRSLLKLLCLVSAIISIIDWLYYFICYRNNSINTPDSFFFFVVPAAIYVWTVVYVAQAYSKLWTTEGRNIVRGNAGDDNNGHQNSVTDSVVARFIILRGSTLLLDVSESSVRDCAVDTPLVEIKPLSYKGSEVTNRARSDFEHRSGLTNFKIKLIYTSFDRLLNNTILHFLVKIDENGKNEGYLSGEWVTLDGIDRMMRMGVLAPPLADEFFRIYTFVMAWRTYDEKGRRKFPIRNYRPNFRLNELYDYDIDYNDEHWYRVSRINQDSRLWHLRKWTL